MNKGYYWLLAFLSTILLANVAVKQYGVVLPTTAYAAPAAVFFVGISFTLRDVAQRYLGAIPVAAAVVIGAVLSWFAASPGLAVASGVAFAVSELLDLATYTALAKANWAVRVGLSNVVGAVIDSWVFLTLAFGSLAFLEGQVFWKLAMTGAALVVLVPVRKRIFVEA